MSPEEALIDITRDGIELGAGDFIDVEALKVAAKALEKQIKAKPVIVTLQNVDYPKCPKCGRVLWPSSEKYCATCGQCILWEAKE